MGTHIRHPLHSRCGRDGKLALTQALESGERRQREKHESWCNMASTDPAYNRCWGLSCTSAESNPQLVSSCVGTSVHTCVVMSVIIPRQVKHGNTLQLTTAQQMNNINT